MFDDLSTLTVVVLAFVGLVSLAGLVGAILIRDPVMQGLSLVVAVLGTVAIAVAVSDASNVDTITFVLAGEVCLAGAFGVVLFRNPVHSALSLVATLFGIAVLFVAQEAHFLAAVQVIVYAGAIVVLFLFVIMLLGVDREEDIRQEPLRFQRPAALIAAGLGLLALVGFQVADALRVTGASSVTERASGAEGGNIAAVARALFGRHLFAFEITSVLLVIAVVGAVVLARRMRHDGEVVER